jgi:hypothetical protein
MQIIPLQAVPSQAVSVTLAGQNCQINLYAKLYGMFADLYVSNALVVGGILVLDRNRMVRSTYLGFVGDLIVYDTQGANDPAFDGLGSRYLLAYLEADELVAA